MQSPIETDIMMNIRNVSFLLCFSLFFFPYGGRFSYGRRRDRCKPGTPDKAFMVPEGTTVTSLAFSRSGGFLAAGTVSGSVFVFSVKKTNPPVKLAMGGSVRDLLFLKNDSFADGDSEDEENSKHFTIAVGGDFGIKILRFDPSGKIKVVRELQKKGVVMALARDSVGKYMASAGRDRKVTLWRLKSWKKESVMAGHTSWISALVFSVDGKKIYSAGWDNTVRGYGVADGKLLWTNYDHGFAVNDLMIGRDGKTVFSVSDDRRMQRIRLSDGKSLKKLGVGPAVGVVSMGKGKAIVLATWRGRVRFYSYSKLRHVRSFRASSSTLRSLAGLPSGVLAVGGEHGAIKVWAFSDGCLGK